MLCRWVSNGTKHVKENAPQGTKSTMNAACGTSGNVGLGPGTTRCRIHCVATLLASVANVTHLAHKLKDGGFDILGGVAPLKLGSVIWKVEDTKDRHSRQESGQRRMSKADVPQPEKLNGLKNDGRLADSRNKAQAAVNEDEHAA